jgi:L-ascorbate metabolism protein UlaG (beta-lactamase superfamily)
MSRVALEGGNKTGGEKPRLASDHYDGERFFNPSGIPGKNFSDVLRWWWREERTPWPKSVEVPVAPPLPVVLPKGELHVTFIGHATFLLRTSEWSLLTDPHFTERASPMSFAGPKRVRRPAYTLQEIPKVDFVFVSHNHYDHMDIGSLREIQKRFQSEIIVPLKNEVVLNERGLNQVTTLDWWQTIQRGTLKITLTPAEHWSARGLWDRNKALWGGAIIEWGKERIFFAGDTGYGPHFSTIRSRLGQPSLSLLPIGAYEPRWFMKNHHMNPDEAVMAHVDLAAKNSLGMHFGTFQLTNEGLDDPEKDLTKALRDRKVSAEIFRAARFGETMILQSSTTSK